MASRRNRTINLPAPYLRRIWLDPRCDRRPRGLSVLPAFPARRFRAEFRSPITIIVGENGTGKSTLLEGIAVLAGYDEAGGGKGYQAGRSFGRAREDGRRAVQGAPRELAAEDHQRLVLPRRELLLGRAISRRGRQGCPLGGPPPDFLSHSHGEGFLRFFEERCQRQGIFIFDEPESALSPARQMEFLKLLRRMEQSTICQVVMATHSPMLMAYPNARLLRLSKYGLEPVTVEETDHYKLMREFCADPAGFVEAVVGE